MACIVISENGIVGADGITHSNRLILAQFCLNAYEQLMAQGQPQYQAAYEPRQPEQNGAEPQTEAQQAE